MRDKYDKRPDFFIVGAPKSATTYLDRCLRMHPDVFIPRRKEVHFFGADLTKIPNEYFVFDEGSYLKLFKDAGDKQLIGESSVMYLYSRTAAREIKAFNPAAKAIIMLRNPVEMLYAYHSQLYWGAYEDIAEFSEALAAEAERKQGRRIPRFANMPDALLYREVGQYAEQVRRYFDTLGRDNVHVIIYDDLRRDPQGEYRKTLQFLGVNPDVQPELSKVNPNKRYRSRAVQEFVARPPWPAHMLLRLLPSEWRIILLNLILRLNTVFGERPRMDPEVSQQLTEYYREEIRQLGQLLNRDLSHWSQPKGSQSQGSGAGMEASEAGLGGNSTRPASR